MGSNLYGVFMKDWKKFTIIVGVFVGFFFIPFDLPIIKNAIMESFFMMQEYARDHVTLSCSGIFYSRGDR